MSTFSEFSKHASHEDESQPEQKKPKSKERDISKNRIDPNTGNEREDREWIRDSMGANNNPNIRTVPGERSQDQNSPETY